MSPSRRSLTIWSPTLTHGDYDTSLVIAGLDMLEIGARQLNDWRLRELPDVLPFRQPGVPLNTPILSLAATSSLPTTWSVHITQSITRTKERNITNIIIVNPIKEFITKKLIRNNPIYNH